MTQFVYLDNRILRLVAYSKDSISTSLQLQNILPVGSEYKILMGPFSFLEFIGAGGDLEKILDSLEPKNFKPNEINKENLIKEWKRLQDECLKLLRLRQDEFSNKVLEQKQRILQPYVMYALGLWAKELQDPWLAKFCSNIAWDRLTRPRKLDLGNHFALKWAEELVELAIEYSINGQHFGIAGIVGTLLQKKSRQLMLHGLDVKNPLSHVKYQGHNYDPNKDLCDTEFIDFSLSGFSFCDESISVVVLKDPIRNPRNQTLVRLQSVHWLLKHMEKKTGKTLLLKSGKVFDFDIRSKTLNHASPIIIPLSL